MILRSLKGSRFLSRVNGFDDFRALISGSVADVNLSGTELALVACQLAPALAPKLIKLDLR